MDEKVVERAVAAIEAKRVIDTMLSEVITAGSISAGTIKAGLELTKACLRLTPGQPVPEGIWLKSKPWHTQPRMAYPVRLDWLNEHECAGVTDARGDRHNIYDLDCFEVVGLP